MVVLRSGIYETIVVTMVSIGSDNKWIIVFFNDNTHLNEN